MFIAFMNFLASLGFGIIFDLRGKKLIAASINGTLGGIVYNILLDPYGSVVALFCASVTISIFAMVMARILKCPTTILLISALVPLVPGGMMYYTVLDFINGDMALALNDAIKTFTDVGAIVIGIVIVSGLEIAMRKLIKRASLRSPDH